LVNRKFCTVFTIPLNVTQTKVPTLGSILGKYMNVLGPDKLEILVV
jgi:hypothetical protein